MEMIRGIKLITETCFQITKGERVIIVAYGDEDLKVASLLAAEMKAAQAEVGIVIVEPPKEIEPPPFLAEAMKKVDVLISLGNIDYGHTMARKEAPSLKYAYMPTIMMRAMAELNFQSEDLLEVEKRTEQLAEVVSKAKEAHLFSAAGTDLILDIEGRRGIPIHPIFRKPGHLAIIPFYAEVAVAPVEHKARGAYVVNGNIWGHPSLECIVKDPIYWEVQNGKVVDIRGGKEANLLRGTLPKFDENAFYIGELGIGTNHKLPNRLTGTKMDDAIFGHVHIALGRNMALGGTQWSQIHVDFLSRDIKLELDGKTIIENGCLQG